MPKRQQKKKDEAKREPSRKRSLEYCVSGFLELVMVPPDPMPRAAYKEREILAELRGFNKAQETLRDILTLNGTPPAAALARIRSEGQQEPTMLGDKRVWIG